MADHGKHSDHSEHDVDSKVAADGDVRALQPGAKWRRGRHTADQRQHDQHSDTAKQFLRSHCNPPVRLSGLLVCVHFTC
jgi:hypothetical protein